MSARIRENSNSLFETYIEISMKKEPFIEFCIPDDLIENKELCATFMGFCIAFIPSTLDCRYGSQFYVFVQTEIDSIFKFGFCCYSPLDLKIRCFISYNPYFTLFNSCFSLMAMAKDECIINWVKELHTIRNITPYKRIENLPVFDYASTMPCLIVPNITDLPFLNNTINISTIMKRIDLNQIIQLYIAAILERRILILSKKISSVSAVVHGISSLLYPLAWENIFIPLLPKKLIEYLQAPMPFIIGIHKSIYEKTEVNMSETVIMDLDENTLIYPHEFEALDQKLIGVKKINKLVKDLSKKNAPEEFCEIFVRFHADIFGYYALCIEDDETHVAIFNKDKFFEIPRLLGSKHIELLKHLIHSQSFTQFIDRKIKNINNKKLDTFDTIAAKICLEATEKLFALGYHATILSTKKMLSKSEPISPDHFQRIMTFSTIMPNKDLNRTGTGNTNNVADENEISREFKKFTSFSSSRTNNRLTCTYINNESPNISNKISITKAKANLLVKDVNDQNSSYNLNPVPPKPRKLRYAPPQSRSLKVKNNREQIYDKIKVCTDSCNSLYSPADIHVNSRINNNHAILEKGIINEIKASPTNKNEQIDESNPKTSIEKSSNFIKSNESHQILEPPPNSDVKLRADDENPLYSRHPLSQRRSCVPQKLLSSQYPTLKNPPIVKPRPLESKTFTPKPSPYKVEQIHSAQPLKKNINHTTHQPETIHSRLYSTMNKTIPEIQKTRDISPLENPTSLSVVSQTENLSLNKALYVHPNVSKPLPTIPPQRPHRNHQLDIKLSNMLENKEIQD